MKGLIRARQRREGGIKGGMNGGEVMLGRDRVRYRCFEGWNKGKGVTGKDRVICHTWVG